MDHVSHDDTGAVRSRTYCTYFDANYLAAGKAMISSLRAVGEDGHVLVVCFDDETLAQVSGWELGDVRGIGVHELEARFPMLTRAKADRSAAEYFFTCTPWVTLFAMEQAPALAWVTYLDADLFFFGALGDVYDELAAGDVGIIAHDYLPTHRGLERFGRFNVGWVSFRAGPEGHRVLRWWADSCLEWCGDSPEPGRFADQGYLDRFSELASGVVEIAHPGANLAPWNTGSRIIRTSEAGAVLVDDKPLLFFHFHGLRRYGARFVPMHIPFGTSATELIRECVYRPYVEALLAAEAETSDRSHRLRRPARRGSGWRGVLSRARRRCYYAVAVARGESIRICDGPRDAQPRLR